MDGLNSGHLRVLLRWFKEGPPGAIPLGPSGCDCGALQAVTWEDAGDAECVEQLAHWRMIARLPGATTHTQAVASVRRWLTREVLPDEDRVLFWIKDGEGQLVGHLGLEQFDFEAGLAQLSDVLCEPGAEALLSVAEATLTRWTHETFGLRLVESRVISAVAA